MHDEYRRGYRDGIRYAVRSLHHKATMMDDPNMQRALNGCAHGLGSETVLALAKLDNGEDANVCPVTNFDCITCDPGKCALIAKLQGKGH